MSGPVQVPAAVVANEPAGGYRRLVLAAPLVAGPARPGQFVALAVGGAGTPMLLRRAVSLHRADAAAGTVEIVLAAHGPGSTWVTERGPGERLDVIGPLGCPFPQPAAACGVVLVGGGYGSAPLVWLAEQLSARGHPVHAVIGAADAQRLFGVRGCEQVAASVRVSTDDGSAGTRGRVTDVLPVVLAQAGAGAVLYACGPMGMLRAVADLAAEHDVTTWCTVEEAMACGIGVCMTCVLPVRGGDGRTRMSRACTEGPTFAGDALRWDAIAPPGGVGSSVPSDCLGAPATAVAVAQ